MGAKRCGARQTSDKAIGGALGHPLELQHVLEAIESLYTDQIKPASRVLRKRISELFCAKEEALRNTADEASLEVDMVRLRTVCDGCELLRIDSSGVGDWAVTFADRVPDFVDVYDTSDPYSVKFWCEFVRYCNDCGNGPVCLPGGRYACARELAERQLPLFAGLSLGTLTHIVQLALHKKYLGYSNGSIVPYGMSQSMAKEQSAKFHIPCSQAKKVTALPAVNLWQARSILSSILDTAPGKQLPLPNVKRQFRTNFFCELSETAFGYSKVSEFLQSPEMADICSLLLQGQGYVVVPAGSQRNGPRQVQCPLKIPLPEVSPEKEPVKLEWQQGTQQFAVTPVASKDEYVWPSTQKTFLQFDVPSTPTTVRQAKSAPFLLNLLSEDRNEFQDDVQNSDDQSTIDVSGSEGIETPPEEEELPGLLKHSLTAPKGGLTPCATLTPTLTPCALSEQPDGRLQAGCFRFCDPLWMSGSFDDAATPRESNDKPSSQPRVRFDAALDDSTPPTAKSQSKFPCTPGAASTPCMRIDEGNEIDEDVHDDRQPASAFQQQLTDDAMWNLGIVVKHGFLHEPPALPTPLREGPACPQSC
mmetsp:Transcript_141490/g.257145  ORF Transcript_141490/g.257145 Transcript_141490/m.257145 type:complete len:588 (+) Transcript_141490:92-1855(+)